MMGQVHFLCHVFLSTIWHFSSFFYRISLLEILRVFVPYLNYFI